MFHHRYRLWGAVVVIAALAAATVISGAVAERLPAGTQACCLADLRLREAPARGATQVGSLFRGQIVCALERVPSMDPGSEEEWCRIQVPGGPAGFASMAYLSLGDVGPLDRGRRSRPRLARTQWLPCTTRDLGSLGLTGANKVNGREYRLRTHLVPGGKWVGPPIPAVVPRRLEPDLSLVILDRAGDGWLALYRSGTAFGFRDSYRACLYGRAGETEFVVDLDRFLPSDQDREIQDIRYTKPLLLFNAACAGYAAQAGNRCSRLIAIDPRSARLVWRTPALVSNNLFIVEGDWIFCGYGFSSEPDFLYIVDRNSGQVVWTTRLDSAHEYLELNGDKLSVVTTRSLYRFHLSLVPGNGADCLEGTEQ